MALRDKLRRLEKTMRGKLAHFELADGQTYYFDPEEAFKITFRFFTDSMYADWRREPRPEPPEVLMAVADARDRGAALEQVMGGTSHLPVDVEELVERGEFVPRSLLAGHSYEDLGISDDGG
jgi:hypothetical protein